MGHITLILGGVRSGKSAYAEQCAASCGRPKLYLATAEALDEEMAARIATHRQRRGDDWGIREEPLAIAQVIASAAYARHVILVDCLTLWLSNLMQHGLDIAQETERLLHALQMTQADTVLVSSEVGQGIMPDNALSRRFCDHAGRLHQQIAAAAQRVIFVTAGLPCMLKGT